MRTLALNSAIVQYRHWWAVMLFSIFSIMMYPPNWYITANDSQQSVQIVEEEETQLAELASFSFDALPTEAVELNLSVLYTRILLLANQAQGEIIYNPIDVIVPPPWQA